MSLDRINTPDAPAPIGPYSQSVVHNGTLYVSGQIPIDPKTNEIVGDTIQDRTHLVMKNIEAILKANRAGFNDIIKCSIFVRDMADFASVNEAYGSYFSEGQYPARETVAVVGLPKDVDVEISCIVAVG